LLRRQPLVEPVRVSPRAVRDEHDRVRDPGQLGRAYHRGVGVFGLMASSSALVIPLTLFFIGTRLWAIGKKFGHMTQVRFFRDRWECDAIGTVIFALTVVMFVPYIII